MALVRLARTHSDLAVAGLLTVLLQIEIWTVSVEHGSAVVGIPGQGRAAAAVAGLALTGSLAWRRGRPLAVMAVAIAVSAAALGLPALNATSVSALALVVATYSVGAHTEDGRAVVGAVEVGVLVVVSAGQDLTPANLLFIGMVLGGGYLAGRGMRAQRERRRTLERLAALLDREREQQARTAVAEERVRIARELHDVVAHAISVMVLQARGGRRSLEHDADQTREALDAIEHAGGQALTEMRRLVGMLRDDGAVPLAPQPSLHRIGALVEEAKDAGLPVDVRVEGVARPLPAGVDLSAFRIVQEALTNVLKHAGPATASVVLRYGPDDLEVEVSDTGTGAQGDGAGGHGLLGVRERVAVYGGTMLAGPREGGGFSLRAWLPLDAAGS